MLSSKAMLVYLSISQWTGRKHDRKATSSVESNFSTQCGAVNTTKKLLPGARELDAVSAKAGSIRKFYYEQTMPWMADGARIISSKNYLDFTREFAKRRADYEAAVEAFLLQYPQLRQEAAVQLGDLFNNAEYPSAAALSAKFNCEVRFHPLPDVGDFRTELTDDEKRAFIKDMHAVERGVVRECFERLTTVVRKAVDTLGDPSARVHDSLIENISDLCVLLPKLNVTDDADLEASRREVEALVSTISLESCRGKGNLDERATAARRLAELNDKMSMFAGGE